MRVLPDVVGGGRPPRVTGAGWRRRLTGALIALIATAALVGCSRFDAALGQRQAVVSFRTGTSVPQRLAVRSACAKLPAVKAQPLPSNLSSPYALQQLTFQINQASDADVAHLETCLAKFPSVAGVTLQDSSDEGN